MQNIYLPNRIYLTFVNGDSWNFDKILKHNKKSNIYVFIQISDFFSFLADFN